MNASDKSQQSWTKILEDMELTEKEQILQRKLMRSVKDKARFRDEWNMNEVSLYDVGSQEGALKAGSAAPETGEGEGPDNFDNFMGINIQYRNRSFVHSKMMSNIPVAMATPMDGEEASKRAARSAESVLEYSNYVYNIDEYISQMVGSALDYGTGFVKNIYSRNRGPFMQEEIDAKTGKITRIQRGDNVFSSPRVWDMFPDASANLFSECEHIQERVFVDIADAIEFFGEDQADLLRSVTLEDADAYSPLTSGDSYFFNVKSGVVEIFEYWEKGMPCNDFKGRLIYHLRNGKIIKEEENGSPCKFQDDPSDEYEVARLPYTQLIYHRVANTTWGRSPAAYCVRAQWVLNACDSVQLQTARAMGIPRLVWNKSAAGENAEDPVSDSAIDIITLAIDQESGASQPWVLQPANTSNDLKLLRQQASEYINDAWGINDSMLGKQQRETQGVTAQLSIQQGDALRADFFINYNKAVKDINALQVAYVIKYWKFKRFVNVGGQNSSKEIKALQGSDIAGGYTLRIDRGAQLPLDPFTRQEQILQRFPVYQQAGIDARTVLKLLRESDHRGIYDQFDKADNRGFSIKEKIIKTRKQQKVRMKEDHLGIAIYLRNFVMDEEYDSLDDEIKDLIDQHIEQREQAAAKEATGGQQAPQGGMPPMPQG